MSDGVNNNVLETLREILRLQMNEHTDYIATGGCKDFADYAHSTGIIKGLALAEREILDLNNRIENA